MESCRPPDYFYVVFCVVGPNPVDMTGPNVVLMLRSEQKIVNSPKAILFDNRTQN
jgi:hypothetical protein